MLRPEGDTAHERLLDFSERLDSMINLVIEMIPDNTENSSTKTQDEKKKDFNSISGNSIPEMEEEETETQEETEGVTEETQEETGSEEETETGETNSEEGGTEESKSEESKTEESKTEESRTEESKTEEVGTEESKEEEAQTGEAEGSSKQIVDKQTSGRTTAEQPAEEITDTSFAIRKSAYSLVTLNYTKTRSLQEPHYEGRVMQAASIPGFGISDIKKMIPQILKARSGVDQLLGAYQVMDTLNEKLNNPATKNNWASLPQAPPLWRTAWLLWQTVPRLFLTASASSRTAPASCSRE